MRGLSVSRWTAAAAAATVFVAAGGSALAEEVVIDGDAVAPITASGPINLGTVCLGDTASATRLVAAKRTAENPTVSWKNNTDLTATASATGPGASASIADSVIHTTVWTNVAVGTLSTDTATVTLRVVAASSPGTTTGQLVVSLSGDGQTQGAPITLTRTATLAWTLNAVSCNTPPTIAIDDVTLQGNTLGGRTLAFADVGSASDAEDSAAPAVTCSPALGSVLPLGETTVTCQAKDSGNLTASDSGLVTVVDSIAPVISGTPVDATVEATSASGAIQTFATPTASDVVSGTVPVTCAPASGSTFPMGPTTVTCTAADGVGNKASSSFQINVLDTTAPVLTQPDDVTEEATSDAGTTVTFSTPTATDSVSGSLAAACTPAPGSVFALGDTAVVCTATDVAGNTGSTSFTVHVVDTTAPALQVPGPITEEATSAAGAVVSYTASATDAVDGDPTVLCAPASGSTFGLGTTEVTCTATDDAGNSAEKSFSVTVEDTTAPVLQDVEDLTVEGNTAGGALMAYTPPTASDLVDPLPVVSCSPGESAFFGLGTTTVTCTATDASGNSSSTEFDVTVVDTTAPTLHGVPSDLTVEGNTTGGAVVDYTPPTASDIVDESPTVDCTPPAGSTFLLGTTLVTCSAADGSGNTSGTASFLVTVEDTTAPTITHVSTLPAANPNSWNRSDVTVTWSCSDVVGVLDGTVTRTVTGEGADLSAQGTCEDTSGNTASDTVSGIRIDRTNPKVSLVGGPASGATYVFGSVPAAPSCTASDALSGLDGTCVVEGYGDTVGPHTVSATATDKAGNKGTASSTYSVSAWTLTGFYAPIDKGVHNVVKGGATVPLKFEVFAGSTELTDTSIATFSYRAVTCDASIPTDDVEVTTLGGTQLRYDATSGQFIQNWQTPKKPGACYKVTMTTLDGSSLEATFKLK